MFVSMISRVTTKFSWILIMQNASWTEKNEESPRTNSESSGKSISGKQWLSLLSYPLAGKGQREHN